MLQTRPALAARRRTVTGKQVRRLRRAGTLPAVLYGHGVPSEPVEVDARAFDELSRRTSRNTLVDLTVDGDAPRRVLIYGVQHNPVTRRPLHVDLFVVRMSEELTVDVPLAFTGIPPAVDRLGGTLFHAVDAIRVRALPDQLPTSIPVDVSGLATFDDAIHVGDLEVPEGVTIVPDADDVVAKVLPPRVIEEEAAPVEEAAKAPAEGAAEAAEAEGAGGEAAPARGSEGTA